MRRIYTALLSLVVFLVILNVPTQSAVEPRQDYRLSVSVCNKGKVPVEVVVASIQLRLQDLARGSIMGHWEIIGETYQPGQCHEAYTDVGVFPELFIGFGFKDAQGKFISGAVPNMPDWGLAPSSSMLLALLERAAGKPAQKTLSRSTKAVCVSAGSTAWSSKSDAFPAADSCRDFAFAPGERRNIGPFYPLTLALQFFPTPETCVDLPYRPGGPPPCSGGDYHMNIVADPASGNVTMKEGTPEGNDAPPEDPRIKALQDKVKQQFAEALLKALKNAADDEKTRKAAEEPIAKAEAARRVFEERQSKIDYNAEHTRNIGRIRELSQFTPDWLRTTEPVLYVRGTVSRVEPPSGPRQPARLYFKESPDNTFIACIPVPQLFDLQSYAGKHLEVRGRVSQSHCGGTVADVQIANPAMILDLAKGTPSDEAVLPGMRTSSSPNAPSAMAAIPIATRLRVTLSSNIDLVNATNNATFQGQLAAPVALPDGVIPQGAAVVLVHNAWAKLGVSSVTADGKVWRVAAKIDGGDDSASNSMLHAGSTLVFTVAGTDRPVVAAR